MEESTSRVDVSSVWVLRYQVNAISFVILLPAQKSGFDYIAFCTGSAGEVLRRPKSPVFSLRRFAHFWLSSAICRWRGESFAECIPVGGRPGV